MSGLCRDVRQIFRDIRRAPAFFGAVVLTLAIGIGANTAIFSVVKTVVLDPLPYPDADELVIIHNRGVSREWSVHPWTPARIARDLMRSAESFEEIAGYYPQPFAVTGGERPYELEGAQVTPGFFRLFQAAMALGRDFTAADARPDAPRMAIISYDVWQRRFGGSPDVIGRSIRAVSTGRSLPRDGELREIIGVLEPGFRAFGPRIEDPGLWIPWEIDALATWAITVARLSEGVPLQRAQSELAVVVGRHGDRYRRTRFDFGWTSLKSELVRDDRTALLILQFAVGVLLLIACVNVANLLLARFSARRTEMAVRSALGASGARLLRRTLTESVVLSVLGGMAALVVMALGLRLLVAAAPTDVPRIDEVSIDGSVFLYTLGIAVLTGLIVGAIPAVVNSRRAPSDVLKEGGRTAALSKRQRRIGHALVIGEMAMVLVLLVGAGLLGRSFVSLTNQDPGFRTEDVVAVSLDVSRNRYATVPELVDFHRRIVERLRRIPGIESVGLAKNIPLDRGASTGYRVDGGPEAGTGDAQYDIVSPGYFRTLDIPLVRGRNFDDTDHAGARRVAIIDEAMSRIAWPGQDPVGKRLDLGDDEWVTVVGVVGEIRGSGLAHDPRPGIYIPYRQRSEVGVTRTVVLVRSRTGVERLAEPLRQGIWDVDPQQPVPEIATLERIVSESVSPQRFRALLLGSLGAVALILAIAGIYGVVERLATQRGHEFGIRMALGARTGDVLRMVIGQGAALAGVGVTLGLLAAIGVTRLLSIMLSGASTASLPQDSMLPRPTPMLYGVSTTDPPTLGAVAVLLAGVALVASYVPARRAAKVDPMVTLNAE